MGDVIASRNPIDADNYHVFSADNPGAGVSDTAGIAQRIGSTGWDFFGSVCIDNKSARIGISEFWGNPNWEGGKLRAALVNIENNTLISCCMYYIQGIPLLESS